ncbi:MAG: hypothetical protein EON57_05435, partial [Alphaproteobacteria bacterium]
MQDWPSFKRVHLMFGLYGRTTQRTYALWSVATLGLYTLVSVLINLSMVGCSGIACLAVGAIGLFIQVPLAAAFIFLLGPPAVRRCRDAGLPPFLGLLVPLLFAIKPTLLLLALLMVTRLPLDPGMASCAALGLVCMLVLCLLPSVQRQNLRRFGWLGIVTVIAAVPALLLLVLRFNYVLPTWPLLSPLLGRGTSWLMANEALVLVIPAIPLLVVAVLHRKPGGPPATNQTAPTELRLPLYRLATLALIVSLVVSLALTPNWGNSTSGMVEMVGAVFGTAILYFAVILAGALALKRRWLSAGILTAIVAALLSPWAYQHWLAMQIDAETDEIVAALPAPTTLATYPTILVVAPGYGLNKYDPPYMPGQTRRIEGKSGEYYAIDDKESDRVPIANLPDRYLLLRRGHGTAYHGPYLRTASHVLSLVADGREQVIAEHYDTDLPPPTLLPVAQRGEWVRGRDVRPT